MSLGTCNTDASIWGRKSNFTGIIMVGMSGSRLYLWDCCCCCRPTVLAELTGGTRADLKDWRLHKLFCTDITNSTIKRLLSFNEWAHPCCRSGFIGPVIAGGGAVDLPKHTNCSQTFTTVLLGRIDNKTKASAQVGKGHPIKIERWILYPRSSF